MDFFTLREVAKNIQRGVGVVSCVFWGEQNNFYILREVTQECKMIIGYTGKQIFAALDANPDANG